MPSVQREGYKNPKTEHFDIFFKFQNINAGNWRIPSAIYMKFAKFVAHFMVRQLLKY